jgi:predicted alpha/beta hydrolase family esterase
MDESVLVVGHSFGGSVLLKYLAEGPPPVPVEGVFLISMPFWGPEGWAYDDYALPADFASRLPAAPIFLYHSREDPHVPFDHLALYSDRLPMATVRPIDGSEHSFMEGLPALVDDINQFWST